MVPTVDTEATGEAELTLDDTELSWDIEIDGIDEENIIAVHIHGPAPEGENGPVIFTLKNQT